MDSAPLRNRPRQFEVFPAFSQAVSTDVTLEGGVWLQFTQQRPAILAAALVDAVLTGTMGDIKLCAYTRRSQMGIVHSPIAIDASLALLEASSPVLQDLLRNKSNKDSHFMPTRYSEYDYEDDSDFEDNDAELIDDTLQRCSSDPPDNLPSKGKDVNPSKTWLLITVLLWIGKVILMPFRSRSNPKPDDDDNNDAEGSAIRLRPKAVVVPQAAAKTWRALVGYIYSNEIAFLPLRSRQNRSDSEPSATKLACSPKSMYRLADQLELDNLKEICSEAIKSNLTPENIIQEVFSDFSWRYPEILEHEVIYLHTHACDSIVLDELKKTSKSLKLIK